MSAQEKIEPLIMSLKSISSYNFQQKQKLYTEREELRIERDECQNSTNRVNAIKLEIQKKYEEFERVRQEKEQKDEYELKIKYEEFYKLMENEKQKLKEDHDTIKNKMTSDLNKEKDDFEKFKDRHKKLSDDEIKNMKNDIEIVRNKKDKKMEEQSAFEKENFKN